MAGNVNLVAARAAKKDEFYTQWNDIENEMQAYLEYNPDVFRGKTVLLPCDDPEWSNFTKYFALNFEKFGLKKLISTSYALSPNPAIEERGRVYVLERGEDSNGDGRLNKEGLTWDSLEGDGDFRSDEVTKLRDEADIVVTNPPFSLFREFMAWLVEGDVKFSIIGNMNSVTYKDVFPLFQENRTWYGSSISSGNLEFRVPESYQLTSACQRVDEQGNKFVYVNGIRWFTNIEHGRCHEPLVLMTMDDNLIYGSKRVREAAYPHYDNYDAIEVPETKGIPSDYDGIMGVPISFLDKYNPEQFEILGFMASTLVTDYNFGYPYIDGKKKYARILIRHRNPEREESQPLSRTRGGRSSLRCKRELSHIL